MKSIQQMKILLVDDMSTVRNIIKKDLELIGAKNYDFATDGDDAWQKILKEASTAPYDIVLSDWNMPRLTGIELLKQIRKHASSSIHNLRFVMITGSDDKVRQAMESGADNFIAKPFKPEELKAKLDFIFRE